MLMMICMTGSNNFNRFSRQKSHLNVEVRNKLQASILFYKLLTIKASEMHYFSPLFVKQLYIFRTDLLSIIRSLNTVFTTIGICHTSYVASLLARSGVPS